MLTKILFTFAVLGWISGLTVHLIAFTNIQLSTNYPFVWLLHIGIFVVWVPVVLKLNGNEELKAFRNSGMANRLNPIGFLKIIFKHTPNWLLTIAVAGFIYAFINFALFMNSRSGLPNLGSNYENLQLSEEVMKTLKSLGLNQNQNLEIRGFSGHWIAFYGLAAAILYPWIPKSIAADEIKSTQLN